MNETFKKMYSLLEEAQTHLSSKSAADKRQAIQKLQRVANVANILALTLKVSK
jgi:hypothetical protein